MPSSSSHHAQRDVILLKINKDIKKIDVTIVAKEPWDSS